MPRKTIPTLPRSALGTDRHPFDQALKENLEIIIGQRGERIEPLPLDASLEDVIRRVNDLAKLLQG